MQESIILRFLVTTAIARPKLTAAVAFALLAALASTLSYTGYLVIGVLAEHLGTGRVAAGLLLAAVLARFPWIRKGKLRIVGLLPQPVRRPFMVGLLALCLVSVLSRGDYVAAGFIGFAAAFVLTFPWLRKKMFDRMTSSVFGFAAGRKAAGSIDDNVIDGDFRERKD